MAEIEIGVLARQCLDRKDCPIKTSCAKARSMLVAECSNATGM